MTTQTCERKTDSRQSAGRPRWTWRFFRRDGTPTRSFAGAGASGVQAVRPVPPMPPR